MATRTSACAALQRNPPGRSARIPCRRSLHLSSLFKAKDKLCLQVIVQKLKKGTKPATLESGAVITVPMFIEIGEVIKVKTSEREYSSKGTEDDL